MKILMINSVCGIRSTGRICTDIAEVLEKEGYECKIAYGRETVPEKYKKYAVKIGSDFGVKVHAVLSRIFDDTGFHSKYATKKLIKWIDEYDPDVIHLHNLHGYYLHIGVLFNYLKSSEKRVIWTLHDCWAFTGHSAYCDAIGCEKWETECNHCPQKKKYPTSLFFDRSKSNYERKKELFTGIKNLTIITPSQWLAGLVKDSFLKEYPVEVIHNGIDLNVFKPTESEIKERLGCSDKKVILGIAAIWDRRKGLDSFIELSEMLPNDYRIVLVGLTRKQIRKLPKQMIGIERTNSIQELVELYSAANVFVNPTMEDNYPTTNIEAIACGTPVITYSTGGSPEAIPDEWKEHLVTKNKNAASLVETINKASAYFVDICDKNSIRERCKDNMSKDNAVNNYLKVYVEGRLGR